MKYLQKDNEIRHLYTEQELSEYLLFRKENDRWYKPIINEIKVLGIENIPLEISQKLEKYHIKETDSVKETIADYGIFIKFPIEGSEEYIPIRNTAFLGLCKISGTNCRAVTNFTPKSNDRILPLCKKVDWIETGCALRDIPCKILVRDEKISAIVTRRYEILPQWELVESLKEKISEEFNDFVFDNAKISHDYSTFSYVINDEEITDSLKGLLHSLNISCEKLKVGVSLATSDIGLSKAYVYLFFEYDNIHVQLPNIADVIHDFGNSVEKFKSQITGLSAGFTENEDRIEELGNINIRNVPQTVKNILEIYNLFSSKNVDSVLDKFEIKNGGKQGTAVDCYLLLYEMAEESKKNGNPRGYVESMQKIAKMLCLDFLKFDKNN